jgi:anhydro-N-acetylmuramic acid kinase
MPAKFASSIAKHLSESNTRGLGVSSLRFFLRVLLRLCDAPKSLRYAVAGPLPRHCHCWLCCFLLCMSWRLRVVALSFPRPLCCFLCALCALYGEIFFSMPSKPLFVLGLMSGTSADAIDVALAKISGAPPNLNAKLLNHTTISYPPQTQKEILRVAEQQPISAGQLSQLNFRLGEVFAEAARTACRHFRISPNKIAVIGSHGQTIFHQGAPVPYLGRLTASTLQIGEPSIIAARTGITTIADFRPADIALGGQGAPLVPYADYLLYRHAQLGRVCLNLGGIANITVLPPACRPSDVFAFDTGPANMLIDALVHHFTHHRQRYDKDAALARQGRSIPTLINELMEDPYLKHAPPKSTGREYYGRAYVERLLALGRRHKAKPNDLIRAATIFTALSVVDALHRFVLPKHRIDQLIVSGGGARNPLLLAQLSAALAVPGSRSVIGPQHAAPRLGKRPTSSMLRFSPSGPWSRACSIEVFPSADLGVPTEAKEGFAFALLAYETFHHRPSNLPSATGAGGPAILGRISYAPPR